jgi:glycosyltransferase involved in cell wall biosynthesis
MDPIKGSSRKIRITFFIPSNILNGAGGERCLFYYLKYAPSEIFHLTVIETDHILYKRITEHEMEEVKDKAKWIQVKDIFFRFEFLANSTLGNILLAFVIAPLLGIIFTRNNKQILKDLFDEDLIYLFVNDNVRFFKSLKATIIGSNHGSFKKPLTFVKKIQAKLIEMGIYQGRIEGFHIFNGYEKDLHQLGKKSTFILPPRGIEDQHFDLKNYQKYKIRFLFVGRLESYKGINLLMDVWKYFEIDERVELHVVGTGTLYNRLSSRRTKNAIFHGAVNSAELSDIYKSSDILIFPSLTEAYPLVVPESLGYGLFVITSDIFEGLFDEYQKMGFLSYVRPSLTFLKREMELRIDRIDLIRENRQKCHDYIFNSMDMKHIINEFYENLIKIVRLNNYSNSAQS